MKLTGTNKNTNDLDKLGPRCQEKKPATIVKVPAIIADSDHCFEWYFRLIQSAVAPWSPSLSQPIGIGNRLPVNLGNAATSCPPTKLLNCSNVSFDHFH